MNSKNSEIIKNYLTDVSATLARLPVEIIAD